MIKDAIVRDSIRDEFGALCAGMMAAGLMNDFDYLGTRGVCDYADLHKTDAWQPYAAMTTAAYAKEFLEYISPIQASQEKLIHKISGT